MRAPLSIVIVLGFGTLPVGNAWTASEGNDPATSLIYMQQRYYDPAVGRFLSVDPVSVRPLGGNFNRYWYANNDPYRFTDPDGRTAKLVRPLIKVLKNGGDVRGALKETKTEIVDSVTTLLDGSASPVEKAAAIFDLASPVSSGELTKGAKFLRNQLQGAIGEADKAKELGGRLAGRQVTIETSKGTRSRTDFTTSGNGVVEVKTGGSRPSPGQRDLHDDLANGTAVTPRGENARAAGLDPGVPIKMKSED